MDDSGSGEAAIKDASHDLLGQLELTVIATPRIGPAGARNAGARRAGGEILAFTDDDCRVDRSWLFVLATVIAQSTPSGAGGRTTNALPGNRWAAASQRIVDLAYAYYNDDPVRSELIATNNLAVSKDAFREVGGFDERYRAPGAEDRDFCRRWRQSGLDLHYARDALVYHGHQLTLSAFARQHFDYGRGAFRYHREAGREGDSQFRRTLGFYVSMPRLLRQLTPKRSKVVQVADLALWQTANVAGFGWEAARSVVRRTSRRQAAGRKLPYP